MSYFINKNNKNNLDILLHGNDDINYDDNYNGDNNVYNKINSKPVFNSKDFISKPYKSKLCTFDENILQFHYSFGYDCYSKMYNICSADNNTVLYAAGNYINIFDTNSGSLTFRKCAGNGGVGHMVKNPMFNHIAIGESCTNPLIIIYEWPTFEVVSVLKGSAKKQINWLSYSHTGKYLCSQGGKPDCCLTIWDWRKPKVVLRTKTHIEEVKMCRFSNYKTHHIVTSSLKFIKFWKISNTFTGLKLKSKLGRFGNLEASEIIGIFAMPDERVISGSGWGNILMWNDDNIDFEVTRKGRKSCHSAPIIKFLYNEHDMKLISVSMDGTFKCWNYHTINIANPPEYDKVLELEPLFTITIQDSIGVAKIMGIYKTNNDPNSYDHFIQDGNGGIWLANTNGAVKEKPIKRLAKFHGDVITSLQSSPIGYFIATTSMDGWFHIYDIINRKLIFMYNFEVPITSLCWLPLKIASSGNIFVIGFKTGVLKVVAVPLMESIVEETSNLIELQASKPHTINISHLTINKSAKIIISGSDDCSIFIYKIEIKPIKLSPIGMYSLPGKMTYIHWKPSEERKVLISCISGHIIEVQIPMNRPINTKESFLLKLKSHIIQTVSVKSEIFRNEYFMEKERKKKEKIRKKKEQLIEFKTVNPDIEIDEELYLEDSDEDLEEPPKLYVPQIPNPVLFAIYTPSEKTIWVSIDGYDAGYLYEYNMNTSKPIKSTIIPDKYNIPLTAINIFGTDSLMILMGFDDGRIRVVNINDNNIYDLSDYVEYSIHDNNTGRVKMLNFSQDNRMLYTYGNDGNIFSFMFQCDTNIYEKCISSISKLPPTPTFLEEDFIKTKEDLKLTLEERKIKKESRKLSNLAKIEKEKTRCKLNVLKKRFENVLISNQSLPEEIRIPDYDFVIDKRFNSSQTGVAHSQMYKTHLKYLFDYEKSLLGLKKVEQYFVDKIRMTTFKIKAVKKHAGVKTIYHELSNNNIFESLVEEFISKKHPKRQRRKSTVLEKMSENKVYKITDVEVFLLNIREMYPSLPKEVQNAIDKLAARINFEKGHILKIRNMQTDKSDDIDYEDEAVLDYARESIGQLKLKSGLNFKPSEAEVMSMEDKFEEYLDIQQTINTLKSKFNKKFIDLKEQKIKLIHDYKQFKFDVNMIQNELNDSEITISSDIPEIIKDECIDQNLIDSFEPIYYLGSKHFLELGTLYPEINMQEYNEKPTYLEAIMGQMRKDELKYRHLCLHDTMLTKINIFDDDVLMLETERIDVEIYIAFLEIFMLKIEEELIILNDFDLVEDEYEHIAYETLGKQNEKVLEIQTLRDDAIYYSQVIDSKTNKLIEIKRNFDLVIRNNFFEKHLRKIFNKKMKISNYKYTSDNESDSSSSSDVSDESSDSELLKNKSSDSLTSMTQYVHVDETVLPNGCDPKIFNLTFNLRAQRYEIEQTIESNRNKFRISNNNLSLAYTELTNIENSLMKNKEILEINKVKKQLALYDVETTILIKKSQMAKVKVLKNAILVNGHVMETLENRVSELKIEKKNIIYAHKDERLQAKKLHIEINKINDDVKRYKLAIKDEILKKCGMRKSWKFIDEMEVAIINYMIAQVPINEKEIREPFNKNIKLLKNKIGTLTDALIDQLRINTIKIITLRNISVNFKEHQLTLAIQQKNVKKSQDVSKNQLYVSDIITLQNMFDALKEKAEQEIQKMITRLKK